VTVRIYHKGDVLHDTRTVSDTKPVPVVAGRTNSIAIEVEGSVPVTRLTLASSARELK
jgi:hypothetical protein